MNPPHPSPVPAGPPTPAGELPPFQFPDQPSPWPPDWWRCLRRGPVSGRYASAWRSLPSGSLALELRVDIDPRYEHSPVLDAVSGDLYRVFGFKIPGGQRFSWRIYLESWVVHNPTVNWSRCQVEISGPVHFYQGRHPATNLHITIPWSTFTAAGPAAVTMTSADDTWTFSCDRESHAFRDLRLEVDVVASSEDSLLLPEYDTHSHPNRPAGLAQRLLTIEECYQEAGVNLTINTEHTVIDDSAAAFTSWSPAELHDAMENHFSRIGGSWPRWEMWGLLAGRFDNPLVGGIMFDAAAAFGGAGDAPERQGFAVFRDHSWFNHLPAGVPANVQEAEALRKFLYTWVHEAGHAFNFLHSWDKGRPHALSWMNYDWKYDALNGDDTFWGRFLFRFDDEELLHIRHGERAAVIMGGDPWSSGGHLESPAGFLGHPDPAGAMAVLEGEAPLELLLRAQSYYAFLEPVQVEVRLRNRLTGLPLLANTQLDPAFGGVTFFIKRPDGQLMQYEPVMCKVADPLMNLLEPAGTETAGADRHSENIYLGYGKTGFYFDLPGEYMVRAVYQGPGDLVIPSNVVRLRVGHPANREEDRMAQDVFTYEVGMALYLDGSRSSHLAKGMNTLRRMAEAYPDSLVGAKSAATVAASLNRPFHTLTTDEEGQLVLKQEHAAAPEEAVAVTEAAWDLYKSVEGEQAREVNIQYHQLVRQRAQALTAADRKRKAKSELNRLQQDLSQRGVNTTVLEEIETFSREL